MRRRVVAWGREAVHGLLPAPDAGTGVLVLGMHRSGTSALTRVVNLLGVPIGRAGEVTDEHWESGALMSFQNELLRSLGGTWSDPPALRPGWERHPRLLPQVAAARRAFDKVYGELPLWVWKDPRTSLTLPFWRRALRMRTLAIVIYRNPLEVWRSLEAGDLHLDKPTSLALWERYNLALLENVAGLHTLVVGYHELVADPLSVARSVRWFLRSHGVPADEVPEEGVLGFVDPAQRHATYDDGALQDDPSVTPAHRALLRRFRSAPSCCVTLPGREHERFSPQPALLTSNAEVVES